MKPSILECMSDEILRSLERDKKKHIKGYVCCARCKRTNVTLRKINGVYFCNNCLDGGNK